MTRYVAFLRGINLGNRRVKLDQLTRQAVVRTAQDGGFTPHLILLREEADGRIEEGLSSLETPDDKFHVLGREVVWFRRGGLSESSITAHDLEKALGGRKNTMRKLNTIQRIVAKFGE